MRTNKKQQLRRMKSDVDLTPCIPAVNNDAYQDFLVPSYS